MSVRVLLVGIRTFTITNPYKNIISESITHWIFVHSFVRRNYPRSHLGRRRPMSWVCTFYCYNGTRLVDSRTCLQVEIVKIRFFSFFFSPLYIRIVNNEKFKCINVLQRVSSDPSEQSIWPSQTFDFRIHCLLEHVASFKAHASIGRMVVSIPEINKYL